MKLFIARHAQSQGNESGLVQGQGSGDPALTARGKRQAQALGKLLAKERIHATYCSPLRRAHQTAEIVGKEPILIEQALRENRMGKLEGITHEQADERFPGMFKRFFEDSSYRIPGGESLSDVHKRLKPFLKQLYNEHTEETVLIVAHSTINRVLLGTLLGIPINHCRAFKQKNASLSTLYVGEERVELYSLNNELHWIQ